MSDLRGVTYLPSKNSENYAFFLWHFDTRLVSMGDLADAFAELNDPEGSVRSRQFPVASRNFIQRKKDEMKRKDRSAARKLIRPKNAKAILDLFPTVDEQLHGITCGDFVMGDLITEVVGRFGCPLKITISTLSMSVKNTENLADLLRENSELLIEMVVSHYFQSTNGDVFLAINSLLTEVFPDRFEIGVTRSHAKIILFDYPFKAWVVETSANLRSSNNIEQFVISNDRDLLEFHCGWIRELMEAGKKVDE